MATSTLHWIPIEERHPQEQRMVFFWMVNGHRGPIEHGFKDIADKKFKIMVMGGWSEVRGDEGYGRITHWAETPTEGPSPRFINSQPHATGE